MTSPTGRHPALVSCLGAAPGVDQPAASALQSGQQSSLGREEDAMADAAVHQESAPAAHTAWPAGISRVPYWLYQDPAVLRSEQQRIFEGPVWNYLCLEADIPAQGDYRTTFVGAMSVIVVRGAEGAIHAFE